MTRKGRQNVEKAVTSLSAVGTLGATLEFGFGVEDLVRSMAKSEHGTVVLTLCAALMECYSIDIATEVLLELARLTGVGGEWMPSSLEWKAMLKACSGVLATTDFPIRAEVLMHLRDQEQRLGAFGRLEALPKDVRTASSPNAIAEALLGMAAISRREMEAMTLVGGSDTGWLAAVAEWFLDFKVLISLDTGETLYTNADAALGVQLQVIYATTKDGLPQDLVYGRTYVLKEISEILSDEAVSSISTTVSGRVEWNGALRAAFLSDFKRLKGMPELLGGLLGSAARIFRAVALADKSFAPTYLRACSNYSDQSFGAGFVTNILHWFPELSSTKEHMETAVAVSLKDARLTYETCITKLRDVCSCAACKTSSNGFTLEDEAEMTPAPDEDESEQGTDQDSVDDWDPDTYCAVLIAETIIVLSRALANVSLDDARLCPMRSGFELAYSWQLTLRRSAQSGKQAIQDLGQIAFCMDFDANFSFGMREHDDSTGVRLHTILELFTGERAPSTSTGISAICKRGICVYLGILQGVSTSSDGVSQVHVIPGRIQHEKKSYERLEDRYIIQDEEYPTTVMKIVEAKRDWDELKLSVKESSTTLECLMYHEAAAASGVASAIAAGPANMAGLLAVRRGLIRCRNISRSPRPCEKVKSLNEEDRRRLFSESGTVSLYGHSIHFLRCSSQRVASAILAHSAGQYIFQSSIFIGDGACLDCCLRTAAKHGKQEDLDLFFLYLT